MPEVGDRRRTATPPPAATRRARPVVLGTLSVAIDPSAEEMAISSALEAGVPLVVANMLALPPYPATLMLAGASVATLPHEEALDEVRATARRAAGLGIRTELLRITSRRRGRAPPAPPPPPAPGLLVFGPHLGRAGRWRFRAAARQVRRDAGCLVWIAPDG
jgi:hypothetical protein